MKHRLRITFLFAIILLLGMSSCHVERFIGDNNYVLRSNQFDIQMPDNSEPGDIDNALSGVRNYATQTSNKRFLGLRAKLFLYTLSNPDKERFPHKQLRKWGEEPVVIDPNATRRTISQIKGLLDSKGCFSSDVSADTVNVRSHHASVRYTIRPTQRYRIDEIRYTSKVPAVDSLLYLNSASSFLKVNDCYDQDLLSKERDRIASLLQNEGYYYAAPELVTFLVDTTFERGRLSIDVIVSNPVVNGSSRPLQKYRIGEVYIFPNSSRLNPHSHFDTLHFDYHLRQRDITYHFIYDTAMALSPKSVSRSLFVWSGRAYRPRTTKETYNSLLNLKNFKYIGIDYQESPLSTDSARLVDAFVRLQNNPRQKISASVEISNMSPLGASLESEEESSFIRNGNFGLETVLEYQNRNLFGGAEIFKTEASLLVELPKFIFRNNESSGFHDVFSSFQAGLDMSLDIPQFLLPFTQNLVWQRVRPHTMIALGSDYEYRNYFERFLADASFGYAWRHRKTRDAARPDAVRPVVQHQLIPLELAFVRFFNLDQQFVNRLNGASDLRLKYQYSDHFIMDARYNLTLNTQQFGTRQNFHYLNLSLETAGNFLQGLSLLSNGPADENGIRQIFGVPYAQYAKVSIDAKKYLYHSTGNTFVARLLAGVGLPYSNSLALPYEKSFYGGGPSTMRAWQLRRLGPGSYQGSEMSLERIGDISIVLNLEERFPLFWNFEGAAFVDAGNVWLMNKSQDYPDGEWRWSRTLNDIAVGTGLGIRLTISVMTIRCDFAIPLVDPGYADSQRFRPPHWKFNQIVTNFGIDYPF